MRAGTLSIERECNLIPVNFVTTIVVGKTYPKNLDSLLVPRQSSKNYEISPYDDDLERGARPGCDSEHVKHR